jgi:hypothetical protein
LQQNRKDAVAIAKDGFMVKQTLLVGGLVLTSLGLAGCVVSRAPIVITSTGAPPATQPAADASNNINSNDEAADLARRTSQYANKVAPLLAHPPAASQPSIVQWDRPSPADGMGDDMAVVADKPAKVQDAPATQPAAPARAAVLAADRTALDSGVPLILPESADHQAGGGSSAVSMSSDEYEKKLAQAVHDYPRDLGSQLDYELLRFVRDEPTPDLAAVSPLPVEDREILAAMLDGLNNFRDVARSDSNPMLSKKIQPLLDMADRLRSQAELTIPTMALCSSVDRFGVYTPITSTRFGAGKVNSVVVYSEVANFSSIQDEQKMWHTQLKQEMVLYTESGLAVWPEKSNVKLFVDTSHNRRHDFFVARNVNLPASLTIGRYLLKVTLTDDQSNRVAESTTPIEIVAE